MTDQDTNKLEEPSAPSPTNTLPDEGDKPLASTTCARKERLPSSRAFFGRGKHQPEEAALEEPVPLTHRPDEQSVGPENTGETGEEPFLPQENGPTPTNEDSTPVVAQPAPRVTPRQWEENEPVDTSYSVAHIDARDVMGVPGWRISGASRRGKMHAHDAKYREDAWHAAVSRGGGWLITAVADGGGSYTFARVGSNIAARTVVKSLAKYLPEPEGDFLDPDIRGAFNTALTEAYHAIEWCAQRIAAETQQSVTSRDLSTTVLALAFCPAQRKLATAQVGDGLIVLQRADTSTVKLAEADVGEVAGSTVFLNNVKNLQWNTRIKLYNLSELPVLIVAMTDGVSDDVLDNEEQNLPKLLEALQHFTHEENTADAISSWLTYNKRGSFDDRTLAIIYPR